jgi:hypothetical protein
MNDQLTPNLWADFISVFDYILLPFFLLIIYGVAFRACNKKYPKTHSYTHPWRKYFLAGFSLKIFGAIFIGLVYQYYYGGGDTSAFYYHATVINQSLGDSPLKWLNLVFHIPGAYDPEYYQYINQMFWYKSPGAYLISSITAVFNVITFNTYLPTSIIFAALSFSGIWAMFRAFAEQYPKHTKEIAICILFIPSTFVWGSGIFKDTVCMAALGWMTFASFRMLIRKQFRLKYMLIIIVCFYLLAVIKIYIVLVFIPALTLWILNTYSHKIKNGVVRFGLKLFVYGIIVAGFFSITSYFSDQLGQYSLENLAETSNTTRSYIYWASTSTGGDEGSKYDLGGFDPTPLGMLSKFPLAVNVSLFRPYIWESRKPMVFLNSLEASLFLFLTLKLIFVIGFRGIWRSISRSPNIQFFLIFTIIFAFAVGISSYNFGALSRYRIPCLPFFALALALIWYDNKPINREFFSLRFK